jgi:hypothetical protein
MEERRYPKGTIVVVREHALRMPHEYYKANRQAVEDSGFVLRVANWDDAAETYDCTSVANPNATQTTWLHDEIEPVKEQADGYV